MTKNFSLQKILFFLFLAAIFFFKIPNFYFLPQIPSSFFTTQSAARAIILLLFVIKTGEMVMKRENVFKKRESKRIVQLCLLLFLFQSISIIEAINMVAFLNRYKDVVVGLCSLFVFYYYKRGSDKIITVFLYSVLFNAFFQFLILFDSQLFLATFSPILYKNYLGLLIANIDRGRIYVPTYDEMVVPFLFLPQQAIHLKTKILPVIAFLTITFFALASNIRSSVLVFGLGLLGSLISYRKIALQKIILSIGFLLLISYFTNSLLVNFVGFSFYDRLTFQNQAEDVDTISQRGQQIEQSIAMANTSIFGVGLGNYYDNVSMPKIIIAYSESRRTEIRNAREYVHNIFGTLAAESGYVSLAVFIVIMLLFVKQDILTFKGKKTQNKAFVIAFWALFSWGLVNPPVSGTYQVLFWGIRGLLLI